MIWASHEPSGGTPHETDAMANLFRKLISVAALLALALACEPKVFAQTSVAVEVRVFEVPHMEMEMMGGTIPKPGFVKSLSRDQANALAAGTRSRLVHRIELPVNSGSSIQVRLDSRISVTSSSSGDAPAYFDAGIGLDISPKVFQSRDISLSTGTQVRVRRGPDAEGATQIIFENPLTRFDTRIHEGESIILGGFISAAERMTLPQMPALPDNPILNYLYPRTRLTQDRPEIAIMLTPGIAGPLINAATDPPVVVPAIVTNPTVVSPQVASGSPVVAGSNAIPVPFGTPLALAAVNPSPAVASATPVANSATGPGPSPVVDRYSVVTSQPAVVPAPAIASSTPVAGSRPQIAASLSAVKAAPASVDTLMFEGSGGKYTVQVGAFDQLEKAEALRSQLAKKYDMVFVEKATTSKTPYRVRVGRFQDKQAAQHTEKQLADDGIDTYVTTLN